MNKDRIIRKTPGSLDTKSYLPEEKNGAYIQTDVSHTYNGLSKDVPEIKCSIHDQTVSLKLEYLQAEKNDISSFHAKLVPNDDKKTNNAHVKISQVKSDFSHAKEFFENLFERMIVEFDVFNDDILPLKADRISVQNLHSTCLRRLKRIKGFDNIIFLKTIFATEKQFWTEWNIAARKLKKANFSHIPLAKDDALTYFKSLYFHVLILLRFNMLCFVISLEAFELDKNKIKSLRSEMKELFGKYKKLRKKISYYLGYMDSVTKSYADINKSIGPTDNLLKKCINKSISATNFCTAFIEALKDKL